MTIKAVLFDMGNTLVKYDFGSPEEVFQRILLSHACMLRVPHCSGCGTHEGHPFWSDCRLYACARDHEVEHCGVYKEFPSDLFVNQYDPEHGPKSAFTRAGFLAYRNRAGTDKYREMAKKLEEEHRP